MTTNHDDIDTPGAGLLTAAQVCQQLQICRTTLTHLPDLRPIHIGRSVRYRAVEVRDYEIDLARVRDGRTGPGRPRTGDST